MGVGDACGSHTTTYCLGIPLFPHVNCIFRQLNETYLSMLHVFFYLENLGQCPLGRNQFFISFLAITNLPILIHKQVFKHLTTLTTVSKITNDGSLCLFSHCPTQHCALPLFLLLQTL